MRAPATDATGSSGEAEVAGELRRLGWGAHLIGGSHDTGTDIIAFARDSRRVELKRMIGLQVKTGQSFFTEPHRDSDGTIDGWWFRDSDRRHFDYWDGHLLPHLVVLRDQAENRSYWVHVTHEEIVSTGQGAKILVPKANVVDNAHQEALLAVATTTRPPTAWEGTAWHEASIGSDDRLRYALLAPRVVAPHGNRTDKSLDGIEALACQVALLPHFERAFAATGARAARRQGSVETGWQVTPLAQARTSPDWAWRATAALHDRMFEADATLLETLSEVARSPEEAAATAILRAVTAMEEEQPATALTILDAELGLDRCEPGDHAWLQAHRAWANLELGDLDGATDAAAAVLAAQALFPDDLTLSALAASATRTIFDAQGWVAMSRDPSAVDAPAGQSQVTVADLVAKNDTLVSWWRLQQFAWALPAVVESRFRRWSRDPAIRIGGADTTARRLLAAGLQAAFAGDRVDLRSADSLLAQHLLGGADEALSAQQVSSYMSMLRVAGDHKEVKLAVASVRRTGPLEALQLAVAKVDPESSMFTSAHADLVMLTEGADFLTPDRAEQLILWAIATLDDPGPYITRTTARFPLSSSLIELLTALLPLAGAAQVRRIIDCARRHVIESDSLGEMAWSRLFEALPEDAWTHADRAWMVSLIDVAPAAVRRVFQRLTAPTDANMNDRLLTELRDGAVDALAGVNDVRALPADVVIKVINGLVPRVQTLCSHARTGRFDIGGSALTDLVLLNLWHPDQADWAAVIESVNNSPLSAEQLRGPVQLIVSMAEKVPELYQPQIVSALRTLEGKTPTKWFPEDVRGVAAEAVSAFGAEIDLAVLLLGSSAQRASAAKIALRTAAVDKFEMVILLARDSDPNVAGWALHTLTCWAADGLIDAARLQSLLDEASSAGLGLVQPIVAAVVNRTDLPAVLATFRDRLRYHPSAAIRAAVAAAPAEGL